MCSERFQHLALSFFFFPSEQFESHVNITWTNHTKQPHPGNGDGNFRHGISFFSLKGSHFFFGIFGDAFFFFFVYSSLSCRHIVPFFRAQCPKCAEKRNMNVNMMPYGIWQRHRKGNEGEANRGRSSGFGFGFSCFE